MTCLRLLLVAISLSGASILRAEEPAVTFGPEPEWVAVSEALPVPEDVDGAFFLRRQDTLVHLNPDGQFLFQNQMVRILQPQALSLGNLSLVWNPAAGAPTVHSVRIHRDGTVIDVLAGTSFEILRREDQLETAMLDGLLTAVMRVPDLRVGDDLEFGYTAPTHDPTFGATNFGLLFLVQSPPPGFVRLGLSWTEGQEPFTRITPDLAEYSQATDRSITLSGVDIGTIAPPAKAPPRYSWLRILEYSDFASWQDISRQLNRLFKTASELGPGSSLNQEAERIASAYGSEMARAEAALKLVQQQVRYVYVGLNGGNLTPASAEETWQRRYGDCKGKTVTLLALLEHMGIEAEAVLVNNSGADDGLDNRLPSPGLFDHVLVRAIIDGKAFWLDGTLPDVIGPTEETLYPYRWALPLSSKGSELMEIPPQTFVLPQQMGILEIDAREGFDEDAPKISTTVKRGLEGLVQYMQLSPLGSNQLEAAMREALLKQGEWSRVDEVNYRYDRDTHASILTIRGIGNVTWDDEGDGSYDMFLPGGGFSAPSKRRRTGDQSETIPFYSKPDYTCYATTIRLPEETEIENWGFNSTFDTMMFGNLYYRMIERNEGGSIRMVRGFRTEDSEISFERATRDNARLEKFDNSKARIIYDPSRDFEPWGNLRSVPATFEFDWTSADAPCLPPDLETQN